MTKKELIEAFKEFPDDMEVKCHVGTDDYHIDEVEEDWPYSRGIFHLDQKWISLRVYS
jgi:hypothetical protein